MRWRATFLGALAAMAVGARAQVVPLPSARPLRVMSISVCTDQLVLALLPPEQITSVSWLARDPGLSLLAQAATAVAVNHGLGEEVLRDRPDLVVAGMYTSTATRALLRRLGWPLLEVGPADTVAQIRATTRQVARAVGETARGEALLVRMDRQLTGLARDPGPRVRVAAWDGSGIGAARGSLYDVILTTAGAVNITADAASRGVPDPEQLLLAAPALLMRGGTPGNDLRSDVTGHQAVHRIWAEERVVAVPQAAYLCGTPFFADSALRLRAQLRRATPAARAPLAYALPPSQ